MSKQRGVIFCLILLLTVASGAWIADAQEPEPAPPGSEPPAERPLVPTLEAENEPTGDAPELGIEEPLTLAPICGTYPAPTAADCNYFGCENIGCGAVHHYEASCNKCHCGYAY